MKTESFDVVVIGSGIGGLATASLLARLGKKRVLVLEQHFKAGGYTHTFRRKQLYQWDVGLHYVGQMESGSQTSKLLNLVCGRQIRWAKMPDPFEKYVYPDFTFSQYSDPIRFKADLLSAFRGEVSGIHRYFKDIKAVSKWMGLASVAGMAPRLISWIINLIFFRSRRLALMTTGEYLSNNFRDEKLKALLVSQWLDYGLPPAKSSFLIHAGIVLHYLGGGYYPAGGPATFAEGAEQVIVAAGGEVRVSHSVDEILIENGRALGVRWHHVNKPEETGVVKAAIIYSAIGAVNTYRRLLPAEVSAPFADEIAAEEKHAFSHVTLYLGLKESPATLGVKGENWWIYSGYDHDAAALSGIDAANGEIHAAYVSFPTLKDPDFSVNEKARHAAEIIVPAAYANFARWKDQPWKKRGDEYEQEKEKISAAILRLIERKIPGFTNLVEYAELSTPLTSEHFTDTKYGNIYGVLASPQRYGYRWLGVRTPVKNLYISGTDAAGHGITGALMGGVLAAARVLGFSKIFAAAAKYRPPI